MSLAVSSFPNMGKQYFAMTTWPIQTCFGPSLSPASESRTL